jgi:hypothetical protein
VDCLIDGGHGRWMRMDDMIGDDRALMVKVLNEEADWIM